jgi:predicted RNA-binding Zn-ribbon protein involved in translation (DUF1610 family)
MEFCNTKEVQERPRQLTKEKQCPECGKKMEEIDRCRENRALFIWYECSQNDCSGQWLRKMPLGF